MKSLSTLFKRGNFLAGIGAIFGVTARDIMSLNNLSRGTIFPGQRLLICSGYSIDIIQHKIAKNETLGKIARKYNTSIDTICFINGTNKSTVLRIGQTLTIYSKSSS